MNTHKNPHPWRQHRTVPDVPVTPLVTSPEKVRARKLKGTYVGQRGADPKQNKLVR